MYINASQQERNLSISGIYNESQLISAIRYTSSEIMEPLITEHNLSNDDINNIPMDINLVFNPGDNSPEVNVARLKFIIKNTKDVLDEIKKDKQIDINGFSSPYYNLNLYLTEPNKKIFMSAYSNFDDDMLWNEIIEWVDDPT